jgi:hypothetical protein
MISTTTFEAVISSINRQIIQKYKAVDISNLLIPGRKFVL